jgi:hypothetical protein
MQNEIAEGFKNFSCDRFIFFGERNWQQANALCEVVSLDEDEVIAVVSRHKCWTVGDGWPMTHLVKVNIALQNF